MKFLKLGLVVSLAVLFYAACTATETTNTNGNRNSANQNSSPPTASVTPGSSENANATPAARPGPIIPVPPAEAATLFKTSGCVTCHGEDGKGNPKMKASMKDLPDFTSAAWHSKATDTEMIETIKNGHKPMPAYKDKLNDEQIKALVAYARSLAK